MSKQNLYDMMAFDIRRCRIVQTDMSGQVLIEFMDNPRVQMWTYRNLVKTIEQESEIKE